MKMHSQAKAALSAIATKATTFFLLLLSLVVAAAFVGPASAQNANPYQFKKEAFKPDGTPWVGPVHAGDIIKYVLSYKPGTTNSGPVTIDDTLSPNQTYVPPTKASDSGWTWGSSPYSVGNHEQYKHPGFGPNTVKVTVTGTTGPTFGTGDGTIPVPILSLNKAFGVFHHASGTGDGRVDCWDLTTLAKCGSPQPNATSGFLHTPVTPQSVVRGTTLYFLGYRPGGAVTIGCFDGSSQTACADIPLPANVTNMGALAGLVEDNTGRAFAAVNDRVYCRMLPAGTTCAGWPAAGIVSVTGSIAPAYNTNVLYVSMEFGASPTRLYVHHSNALIQCIDINAAAVCPGSWTPAGTKIAGQNDGVMFSSFPQSGSSGDGGVCLWKLNGIQVGCLSSSGAPISVTPTSVTNIAISSFRVPNTGRVFFPTYPSVGGPKCFDYTNTAGVACAAPPMPPNGTQYGFALDPRDPAKCMLALGHTNLMWRFNWQTGDAVSCATPPPVVVTPKIEDIYCNGTPTLATFKWTTIRVMTPGAAGTLTITKGTGTPQPLTITSGTTTYTMPGGIGTGYGQLSFSYVPTSGSPTTVDFEIDYISDKNPQICYQAQVKSCGGPVFNDAIFKGNFNGSPVNVSQRVDLGKAIGPDCPELTGCLKDLKVGVKCNPDGTFTVTLSGAGFPGNDITLTSETPGVTVVPPQQPWAATTTWTLVGATPGQVVKLSANATELGHGNVPGTDLCCSGEITVVMPECPKPPIDVKVDKENTPAGGQGNGFNVWVTNVGAPITFGPGELTVKDVIPPGLTITTQSSTKWTCLPVPATGPATITCTYNLAGSLGTGAPLLDSIVFGGFLTITDQPLKNCAIVSVAAKVGVDTNPSNDEACVTVKKPEVGSLVVKKTVEYHGPIALPTLSFPVTVTCGGTTTTGNVTVSTPLTVNNIPVPNTCTVTEGTPPTPPPNVCPAGTVPTWLPPTYTPASVPITSGSTSTITVHNELRCEKIIVADKIDLAIEKTGGTSPVPQVNGYAFHLKVTNVGQAFNGNHAITVKDVVPAGMKFDAATGLPDWTCNAPPAIPAGGTLTCTYVGTGPTTPGQVFSTININATALGSSPFPPFTNCATVGPTPTSGPVDANPGDNQACVTVVKPTVGCPAPLVPGPIPGVCICPQGMVLQNGKCVPQSSCTPPLVMNAAGVCACPPGTVQRGRQCVPQIVCRPPLIPNAAGTTCVCPPGTVLKGRECVKPPPPPVCKPPARLNSRGACECPTDMVATRDGCIPRARPVITPGDINRIFPGSGGRDNPPDPRGGGSDNPAGPRGGSGSQPDLPGRR